MELLVVRHAIAEERAEFARTGKDDAERPLTAEGRRKLRRGARGLRRVVGSVDLLATSHLRRAVETAAVLGDAYGQLRAVTLQELAPEAPPSALLPWLRAQRRQARVAIVGHEPHLSRLVEHLLAGTASGFVELKKGGACLLELGDDPRPGGARLRWLLTAGQLRRLGR